MNKKKPCESCELRGYSPELCKVHFINISKNVDKDCIHHNNLKELSKTAAVGAGVGLMAAFIGMAAVPAVALKAIFGHVVTVKVSASAGGGVAGAGVSIFRKVNKSTMDKKDNAKKQRHLPLIV